MSEESVPPPASPAPTVEEAIAALDVAVSNIEANARGLSGKDLERNYEAAKFVLIEAAEARGRAPQEKKP